MTREQLIEQGIDKGLIKRINISLDEVSQSECRTMAQFLWNYCDYGQLTETHTSFNVTFHVIQGVGNSIDLLVWLED